MTVRMSLATPFWKPLNDWARLPLASFQYFSETPWKDDPRPCYDLSKRTKNMNWGLSSGDPVIRTCSTVKVNIPEERIVAEYTRTKPLMRSSVTNYWILESTNERYFIATRPPSLFVSNKIADEQEK